VVVVLAVDMLVQLVLFVVEVLVAVGMLESE
jgi:hypothetical protein